jgi:LemA protein
LLEILMIVALVLAGWAVWAYNRLVRDRNRVRAAWSDIDVQLLRRHDLVPRLVEAVRAYADYERATITAVTELRARSLAAQRLADKAQAEDEIEAGVHRLIALAEDYPDLEADENFLELQRDLTEIEDHLQYARRYYNGAVRIYNTRIETVPDLVVARTFGFQASEFFAPPGGEVRIAPAVELG